MVGRSDVFIFMSLNVFIRIIWSSPTSPPHNVGGFYFLGGSVTMATATTGRVAIL